MKKILVFVLVAFLLMIFAGCTDTAMKKDVDDLKAKVQTMEETLNKMQAEKDSIMKAEEMEKVEEVKKMEEEKKVEPVKKPAPKTK